MLLRPRSSLDQDEQRRFAAMNDMLNPTSVGMLRLRGGERILDVGCGLGQLSRAIARAAGQGGSVVAIVQNPSWLPEAKRQADGAGESKGVEFRAGEPHELPLKEGEWGGFDLVHGRFILEQVPRAERVVEAMVRAARPGGRIVLEDDDAALMVLWPEPEGFRSLWDGYVGWCRAEEYDPFVGRRLVSLLHGAGAVPTRSVSLSVSTCAGSPSFKPLVGIITGIFEGAGGPMMSSRAIKKKDYEASMAGLLAWAALPEATLWYSTCWAEGRRPST